MDSLTFTAEDSQIIIASLDDFTEEWDFLSARVRFPRAGGWLTSMFRPLKHDISLFGTSAFPCRGIYKILEFFRIMGK